MPLPFDATLKAIVQAYARDFEAQLGVEGPAPARLLNVDLSTVSAATDMALGHGDPLVGIVDLNFQATRAADLTARVLLYNALLYHRFRVPVHSVVIVLRPAAEDPALTGQLHYQGKKRCGKMAFTFEVVRLWQWPVRRLLRGGLGTLPLALLCRLPAGASQELALAGVIRQIDARLVAEAPPDEAARLMSAAFVLSGLRVPRDQAAQLFRGVHSMRESTTYMGILEEGAIEQMHKVLLRQGGQRFGPASDEVKTAIKGINDLDRLDRMSDRVLTARGWDELLATR